MYKNPRWKLNVLCGKSTSYAKGQENLSLLKTNNARGVTRRDSHVVAEFVLLPLQSFLAVSRHDLGKQKGSIELIGV